MKRYEICGLVVDMDFKGGLLHRRSEKYEIKKDDKTVADIVIEPDFENLQKRAQNGGNTLPYDSLEYMATGSVFYRKILDFDAFMLHSSAVVVDGYAYLFSAPCGTGKSTHTSLWEEYFKSRGAYVINDDKPAIKLENGEFYVYGTPWSGKSDKNVNKKAKLGGVCFLERSNENFIEKMSKRDAVSKFVWQTLRPQDTDSTVKFMSILDALLKKTDIWHMGCRIDYDAVDMAYNAMCLEK